MHAEKLIEQWLQDNQPTRCPTLVADGVKFWSPCSQPKLGEERPLQVISFKAGVGLLYANPGRDRYNQARKAEFQARKELALTLASKGLTAREIAEKMGVPRRTINEYLKGTK
jgi:DNA-binding NarL/FixJ family response regulator